MVRNKPIDILYINIADQTNSIVRKYSDIEQFIRDKIKEIFGGVKLNKKRYGDKKEIIADIQNPAGLFCVNKNGRYYIYEKITEVHLIHGDNNIVLNKISECYQINVNI